MKNAHQVVSSIMENEASLMADALYSYGQAMHDSWFSQQILSHQLLGLLQYASPTMLVESMHALLYAYSHPGTREGFAQLCLGLFGRDAIILLEEEPAVVSVDVYIQNDNFSLAIAQDNIALSEDLVLSELSLTEVTRDPKLFLEQFLPAGVILRELQVGSVNIQTMQMLRKKGVLL